MKLKVPKKERRKSGDSRGKHILRNVFASAVRAGAHGAGGHSPAQAHHRQRNAGHPGKRRRRRHYAPAKRLCFRGQLDQRLFLHLETALPAGIGV